MTTGTSSAPRTILLATDLSPRCDRALDRAIQLARQWQARLVALTVVEPGTLSLQRVRASPRPSWSSASDDPVQRTLDLLRRDAGADDVDIVPRVEEGRINDVLMRVAVEEGAELIVTGVARSESFGRMVLGSSVDWLARHATVPVLVVRDRVHGPYRNIVVTSDFSPSSRLALEAAASRLPEARVTLFHAFDIPFTGNETAQRQAINDGRAKALAEAGHMLEEAALTPEQRAGVEVVVEHGEPVRLTYEYVRDHNADLIALGTHGRSALFDILIGSIAKRILETAATDVLLVRKQGGTD